MLPASLLGTLRQGSGRGDRGAAFSFWAPGPPIPVGPQAGAALLGPPQLPVAVATLGSTPASGRSVPGGGPVGDGAFFSTTGPAAVPWASGSTMQQVLMARPSTAQPEPGRHSPASGQPGERVPGSQASSAPAWRLSSCSPSGSLALPMPREGFSHASPTAGLQERVWGSEGGAAHGPPAPLGCQLFFSMQPRDNRLGGRPEHPPALAQPAWWHPVPGPTGSGERYRPPTVKASLPPAWLDQRQDPGAAAAAGAGRRGAGTPAERAAA